MDCTGTSDRHYDINIFFKDDLRKKCQTLNITSVNEKIVPCMDSLCRMNFHALIPNAE